MDMERVGAPAISPDGRQIVFTRAWIDKMKDQSRSNLWIVDSDGARVRELTSGSWRDSAPAWAPDGEAHRLPVRSRRHQPAACHVSRHRRSRAADAFAARAGAIQWSPDGKQIAFTQTIPDEDPILRVELPQAAARRRMGARRGGRRSR